MESVYHYLYGELLYDEREVRRQAIITEVISDMINFLCWKNQQQILKKLSYFPRYFETARSCRKELLGRALRTEAENKIKILDTMGNYGLYEDIGNLILEYTDSFYYREYFITTTIWCGCIGYYSKAQILALGFVRTGKNEYEKLFHTLHLEEERDDDVATVLEKLILKVIQMSLEPSITLDNPLLAPSVLSRK